MVYNSMNEFEHSSGDGNIAKRQINGNTYVVVLFRGSSNPHINYLIIVFSSPKTGEDDGLPKHLAKMYKYEYEEVVRKEVGTYTKESLETCISQSVNEAVCIVEDKQAEEQLFADKIQAALDANKEIHGNFDENLNEL